MILFRFRLPIPLILLGFAALSASAQMGAYPDSVTPNGETLPPALIDVGIDEHINEYLPLDKEFIDEAGHAVHLSDYFNAKKPVLFNFAYYRCPMLCNLVLAGMVDGIKKMSWIPGREFEVVTLSIDPSEGPDQARAKKATHIEALGRSEAAAGWHFLTGKRKTIAALTEALGFRYRYNSATNDFSHTAAIFTISPDGKICRYLYGVQYPPANLKLALLEASEGNAHSLGDKLLLFCYHFDPNAKGYVLFAQNLMRAGEYLFLGIMVIFFGWLWTKESKRRSVAKVSVK